MQRKKLSLGLACLLLLAGCDTVGGWFSSDEDEDRIGGERLSVLQLDSALEVDSGGDPPPAPPVALANSLWPQAGGYPSHVMGHLALAQAPERRWRTSIGAGSSKTRRLVAPPIVVEGTVYAIDSQARVVAIDAETGQRQWQVGVAPRDQREETLGGGLAFGGGLLLVTAGYNEVLALDPENGGLVWRRATGAPAHAPPTAADGRVFVVTLDNELLAFNIADSEPLWRHQGIPEEEGLLGAAAPAVDGELVVVAYSSGEIVALRAQTGRPAWNDNLSAVRRSGVRWNLGDIRAHPVIDGPVVFAVAAASRLVAIDRRSGARIWQRDVGGLNMPWVAGDWLFLITAQDEVIAIDKQRGRIHWITQLDRYEDPSDREDPISWTGPVLAGGRLIVTGSDERVVELDPFTGAMLREWETPGDVRLPLAVAHETLFLLTEDGDLIAYR